MEYDYIDCGDCLELMKELPNGSIELILTDPPYNIARDNNFTTMGRAGIDFGEWDKGFNQFLWLNEIPRVLKKDGSVIIFNDWKNVGEIAKYCESLGLVIKDMLRWKKSNPMPRNIERRYVTDFECAIWLTNKNAKWTFHKLSNTYERPEFEYGVVSGKEKTIHPTQKPVALMEKLIRIHSNIGDVVFDPFMGSGSTCVAAVNTGRHYIGFEKEPKYFDIVCKRLDEAEAKTLVNGEYYSEKEMLAYTE